MISILAHREATNRMTLRQRMGIPILFLVGGNELRVLWEEILRQDLQIEVLDKPVYAYSNFLHAIRNLPVRIAA